MKWKREREKTSSPARLTSEAQLCQLTAPALTWQSARCQARPKRGKLHLPTFTVGRVALFARTEGTPEGASLPTVTIDEDADLMAQIVPSDCPSSSDVFTKRYSGRVLPS